MTWSPGFIGIGAEKSATTWAWTVLNEHPSVCMSQPKELNYFNTDDNHRRGESWYRKHFADDTSCAGEISPLYMDDDRVAARIRDRYPDTRILVMLRNPFDRAMSHLFHDASVIYGKVAELTPDDLQTLVQKDQKYLRRSQYGEALNPFLEAFPPEQVGVFFFDDVTSDGLNLAQRLYEFVGASGEFVPQQFNQKVNDSQDLRSVSLAKIIMSTSRAAKSFPPTRKAMNWVYRRTQIREKLIRLLMVDRGRPEITFTEVFSEDDSRRLSNDVRALNKSLPGGLPAAWLQSLAPSKPQFCEPQRAVA
ncbi:MAG: sulfotransferase [Fuerstiella sp.]|nr:sulfotransferase [Fuerstiella sp.]MCP4783343.1 sulfotransferase [Fuerstiella sp.]MCP4854759.1 sulfotransferase [Fuerstiella sp.]